MNNNTRTITPRGFLDLIHDDMDSSLDEHIRHPGIVSEIKKSQSLGRS